MAANTNAPVDTCTSGEPGLDTVILPAGVYELTLQGDENLGASGDLDVLDDLEIQGSGRDVTTITTNLSEFLISWSSYEADFPQTPPDLLISGVRLENPGDFSLIYYRQFPFSGQEVSVSASNSFDFVVENSFLESGGVELAGVDAHFNNTILSSANVTNDYFAFYSELWYFPGAVNITLDTSVLLYGSTLSANNAFFYDSLFTNWSDNGGGIGAVGARGIVMFRSTVDGVIADAAFFGNPVSMTIFDSTFTGCSVASFADISGSSLQLYRVTAVDNDVDVLFSADSAVARVEDSIIAGNTFTDTAACDWSQAIQLTATNNVFSPANGCDSSPQATQVEGNTFLDESEIALNPIGYYGG
ncbi:MAG: hypothetical protein KC561_20585, partial [Myxococcales bacterium]|nr:hypothetical protein [Myxococcales bacterium]